MARAGPPPPAARGLAEDYLDFRETQADEEVQQVGSIYARLERTSQVAEALKPAWTPTRSRARWRRSRRRRADYVRGATGCGRCKPTRAPRAAAGRLWALAEAAHTRLGSMEPRQRRAVMDLLNVWVTVTRWRCRQPCRGTGKLRGAVAGPTCHAMRRVPSLLVERDVLDDLAAEQLCGAGSRGVRYTSPAFAFA